MSIALCHGLAPYLASFELGLVSYFHDQGETVRKPRLVQCLLFVHILRMRRQCVTVLPVLDA